MRSARGERPERLMLDGDGTTLDQVIGDLQSQFGVPESPQEFRITIRVSDRESRGDRTTAAIEEVRQDPEEGRGPDGAEPRVKREKAPAAPRVGQTGPGGAPSGSRKRRGRRRKRGGGGGGARPQA